MSLSLLILILVYGSVDSFFYFYPTDITTCRPQGDGDPGEPLFLTPYVEKGDIEAGRKLASVPSDQWLGVKSYAGFFTVDKKFDSNHFFWYFPSMSAPKNAPIILWLNGGVKGSSLMGIFQENGPFFSYNGTIEKREFSWTKNHHMIYLDFPVGLGFSFTNSSEGFITNEEQVGAQLYTTMTQFFQLFPELQTNDFYVVGQLYGGKFATALAYTMYKNNQQPKLKCNFKGLAIGNGWIDPINQNWYHKFLNRLGMIDHNQMIHVRRVTKQIVELINGEKWKEAMDTIYYLHVTMLTTTGYQWFNFMNYLAKYQDMIEFSNESYAFLFDTPAIRKSIHVGNLTFIDYFTEQFRKKIEEDIPKSVAPWLHELYDANYCDIISYNVQLDILQAYTGTERYFNKMNLTDYADAMTELWMVDEDVAGYVKKCHRLTQIMVRNAGQLVPRDQPYWAWKMITSITHKTGFMEDSQIEGYKN